LKKADTTGYVKMWRKSMHDDIFKNAKAWQLFCFCLFNARFKGDVRNKHLKIGELETTYPQINDVCHMSKPTAIKCLKFLKEQGVIDYWTDHQKTYIKILNYEKYQASS
jgi:hypothetical protein